MVVERPMRPSLLLPALLAFALACGPESAPAPESPDPGTVMPDFSLVDRNPNSASFGQPVSPRQHLGKVTAWYFGHVT